MQPCCTTMIWSHYRLLDCGLALAFIRPFQPCCTTVGFFCIPSAQQHSVPEAVQQLGFLCTASKHLFCTASRHAQEHNHQVEALQPESIPYIYSTTSILYKAFMHYMFHLLGRQQTAPCCLLQALLTRQAQLPLHAAESGSKMICDLAYCVCWWPAGTTGCLSHCKPCQGELSWYTQLIHPCLTSGLLGPKKLLTW